MMSYNIRKHTDDEDILAQFEESSTIDVEDKETDDERDPPPNPPRSQVSLALETLDACPYFENQEVANEMRSCLEKFEVTYYYILKHRDKP